MSKNLKFTFSVYTMGLYIKYVKSIKDNLERCILEDGK